MKKRQALVSPRAVLRMLEQATECWQQQDYAQVVAILERASRLDPGNSGIMLDLGRANGLRYEYDAAEQAFERAVAISPKRSDALVMAALHARDFGRFELAANFIERAAAEPSATADTFVKLAELYERLRRLDDATATVERALQKDAGNAMAILVRARLDRLAGRLEDADRKLRPLLTRTDESTWSTRIRGWYELGAVLDRAGQYDEAMEAFVAGKKLILPKSAPQLRTQHAFQHYLKQAETDITAERFEAWRKQSSAERPHRFALLCGHPRSGTTLLEQVLDSHPDIISAEETQNFRDEAYFPIKRQSAPHASMLKILDSASADALRQSRERYFKSIALFLGRPIGDRLLVDKNPSLTTLIPAAARILPETKLLVALRDPRDVCMSCFMQPLPLNPISAAYLTLEETAREYASVMGFWKTMRERLPGSHLEVRYEDLVDDVDACARQVLEFLGIPWDPRVLRFNEHAREKLVRSPTYADVTKPITRGAIGRWKNYQKYLEPCLEKLTPFVEAFGYA